MSRPITDISMVFNRMTCSTCGELFKEGYISDTGAPEYDLVYFCQECKPEPVQYVTESDVQVPFEVVEMFGHFQTLEEVNEKIDDLWGAIDRCEVEGSIPWYKVLRCQGSHHGYGFDLVTVTQRWDNCGQGAEIDARDR
jgi:hypothetical protein